MAFDPDKFLAETDPVKPKVGFDPDKFLAETEPQKIDEAPRSADMLNNFGAALRSVATPMEDVLLGSANYQDRINTEAKKRYDLDHPTHAKTGSWLRDTLNNAGEKLAKGVDAYGGAALDRFTFNQADKVPSAIRSILGGNYQEELDVERAMDRIRKVENPLLTGAGNVSADIAQYALGTGLLSKLPFLAPSKAILEAQKLGPEAMKALPTAVKVGNVAKNALKGGIATAGMGQGQGHELEQAPIDFLLGSGGELVGPALNLAGQGVKKVLNPIKDIALSKTPGVANWLQKRADKKVLALVDDLANQYQAENLSKAGRGFQEGVEQAQDLVESKYQEIKRPIMEKFGGQKVSPKKFKSALKTILEDENALTSGGEVRRASPIFKGENSRVYDEVAAYIDDVSQPMTLREMEQYFQPWYKKAKFNKYDRTIAEEVFGDMYTRSKNAYLDEVDSLLQKAATPQKSVFVRPEAPREFIPEGKARAAFSYRPKAEPFDVKTTVRNAPLEYQAERALQPVPETEVLRDEVARALRVPDSLLPTVQKPTLRVPEALLPREQVGFTTNLQQVEKTAQEYPEFARATAKGDLITGNVDEIKAATDALYTPRMVSAPDDVLKAQAEAEALMNTFRSAREEYAKNQGFIARLMKMAAKDPEAAVKGATTNLPGSFVEEALSLNPAYREPLQKVIVGNIKNTVSDTKQPTSVLAKIMKDYRSESEPLRQLLGDEDFHAILKVLGEKVPGQSKPSLLPPELKERLAAYGSQSAIRNMLESLGVVQGN